MRNIKCRNCINLRVEWCERIWDSTDPDLVRDCSYYREKTNADHIRSMSDEELAKVLDHFNFCPHINDDCTRVGCVKCAADWLKQPYKEDG